MEEGQLLMSRAERVRLVTLRKAKKRSITRKQATEDLGLSVRQWMIRAKLWHAKEQKVKAVHVWRPRRSRFGELVQWDTSEHDWLEWRGEKHYLIAIIDDATGRLFARFVRNDFCNGAGSFDERPAGGGSENSRTCQSIP